MRLVVLLALFVCSSLAAFSWSNCGSSSDPIQLEKLTVSPDPIVLGNNITVGFAASSSVTISSGHKASVKIWKQEFGVWVPIPCVDNVGSCTYDDFCSLFHPHPDGCGPILTKYHLPCQCPFNSGSYSMPPTAIPTKNPGLSWLTDGSFSVQAELMDDSGNRLACYLIYADLTEGKIVFN